MTTALAKAQPSAVANYTPPQNEALKSDVLIPRILLMQGTSDFVKERKAQLGDMVRSTTAEKVGDDKSPIEFIPLSLTNTWTLEEKIGQKFEFRRQIPRRNVVDGSDMNRPEADKQDDALPWEFKFNGTDWRRVKTINCFALLPKDIAAFNAEIEKAAKTGEMPDIEKVLMPVLLSFKSTGYTAGRTLSTHFTKAASFNAKPFGFALPLSCYMDKNDKGSFFVFEVGKSRKCSPEEFAEASKWASVLSNQTVTVHEVDDTGGAKQPQGSVTPDVGLGDDGDDVPQF